jgi:phospholipid transport system transporter-binding protein
MKSSPPQARIEVGNDRQLFVSGVLDMDSAASTARYGATVLRGMGSEVTIDLQAVAQSDSAALAVLIDWLRVARQRQQRLHFINLPIHLVQMAKAFHLSDLIHD